MTGTNYTILYTKVSGGIRCEKARQPNIRVNETARCVHIFLHTISMACRIYVRVDGEHVCVYAAD